MKRFSFTAAAAVAALTLAGCASETVTAPEAAKSGTDAPSFAKSSADEGHPVLIAMNERLAAAGADYRVEYAEYVTHDEADEAGQTIFANNRGNKQLAFHFVSGDPRRGGRTNITYLVDQSDGTANAGLGLPALTNAQTEGALDRSMATWNNQVCSTIPVVKVADPGVDPDVVDGGAVGVFADITHAGWSGAAFFDGLAPGGSTFILGVTFTFRFIDGAGNSTDIDNDHVFDAAFREIYYNNTFAWGIDVTTRPFDIETVALHEAGHGLSQNHFGKIFRTLANSKLHFSPFAVMNASISRQAQALEGTDEAGHCSIWGNWPN